MNKTIPSFEKITPRAVVEQLKLLEFPATPFYIFLVIDEESPSSWSLFASKYPWKLTRTSTVCSGTFSLYSSDLEDSSVIWRLLRSNTTCSKMFNLDQLHLEDSSALQALAITLIVNLKLNFDGITFVDELTKFHDDDLPELLRG